MFYDENEFDRILKETQYQAIMHEVKELRKYYFYEDKHAQVNKEYYEFLAVLSEGSLTIDQRLNMAIDLYRRFYQYMCFFYNGMPEIDIDLLTDDTSAEVQPKRRGRPKGSKNKKKTTKSKAKRGTKNGRNTKQRRNVKTTQTGSEVNQE